MITILTGLGATLLGLTSATVGTAAVAASTSTALAVADGLITAGTVATCVDRIVKSVKKLSEKKKGYNINSK